MGNNYIFTDLNFIVSMVSLLIGVFGVILSIRSIKRQQNLKEISLLSHKTYTVFEDFKEIDGIEIHYLGKQVDNVYQLKIFIQNSGSKTLLENDFLKPFILTLGDETEILNYSIFTSSELNQISFHNSDKSVTIDFQVFLNKSQVMLILYYTAKNTSLLNFEVAILDGSIINENIEHDKQFYHTKEKEEKYENDLALFACLFIHFLPLVLILLFLKVLAHFSILQDYLNAVSDFNKTLFFIVYLILSLVNTFRLLMSETKHYRVKNWIKVK